MKAKIAVATVAGKAYYRIVNELKQRKLLFLSLMPGDQIPPLVEVVITTEQEKASVDHPKVLTYDAESDPSGTVDQAVRIIQDKEAYEELVIGVDPGKTFGIAILGDRKVLKRKEGQTLEMAVDTILAEVKETPAKFVTVRIGNGVPELAEEMVRRLSIGLPDNVTLEAVTEAGTSTLRNEGVQKKLSDAESAIRIAEKKGVAQPRRRGG